MMSREYTEDELARIEVADQLRRMSHNLMRGDHSPAELRSMARRLAAEAELLSAPGDRVRDTSRFDDPESMWCPADGEEFFNSPDRPVSGLGNPWSVPLRVFRHGERAVTDVVLDRGFEGAPGMSHGGVVAAIYDDLLGFLLAFQRTVAFTAYLTVNYHSGTMIGAPLRFEGWIDRVEGRKMFLAGECHSGGKLISSCTGLFIDAMEHLRAGAVSVGS